MATKEKTKEQQDIANLKQQVKDLVKANKALQKSLDKHIANFNSYKQTIDYNSGKVRELCRWTSQHLQTTHADLRATLHEHYLMIDEVRFM